MQLHVIIGTDDYLVAETAKKTIGDGTGLEVIDSRTSTNADLQLADLVRAEESLLTPPFLEPRKVTWWKNVAFLPGAKKLAEEVKAALEKFSTRMASAKLPENQHFILSGPQLLKTSIFAKNLAGAAELLTFGGGKPWEEARDAEARVMDFAAEAGFKFARGAAGLFISIVGTDTRSLLSEIGKLRNYLGSRNEATVEDVSEIASPGVNDEPAVWDVTDAIGAREADKALTAMRRFELQNGFAVMMSTLIEKQFRQMIDAQAGRTEGMNPYTAKKQAGFAAKWTPAELRAARARFLALREKVVSGISPEAGSVLVVTELLRVMRRPRR